MFPKTLRRVLTWGIALAIVFLFARTVPSWSPRAIYQTPYPIHPIAMTLAFIGFLPESIAFMLRFKALSLTTASGKAQREVVMARHGAAALFCKFLAVVGLTAILAVKVQNKKDHFTTLHGQAGIATLALLFVQVVVGMAQGQSKWVLARTRQLHKFVSPLVCLLALVTYYSAFYYYGGGIAAEFGDIARHACGAAFVVVMALVAINGPSENESN